MHPYLVRFWTYWWIDVASMSFSSFLMWVSLMDFVTLELALILFFWLHFHLHAWIWLRHFSWLSYFGQISLPSIYPIVNPFEPNCPLVVLSSLQGLNKKKIIMFFLILANRRALVFLLEELFLLEDKQKLKCGGIMQNVWCKRKNKNKKKKVEKEKKKNKAKRL